MKVTDLRQIIQEEVRTAIKAELKDLLIEAVKIASNPEVEVKKQPVVATRMQESKPVRPLEELLEETKLSFSADDAKSFVTQNMRQEMAQAFSGNNVASTMASRMGMTDPVQGIDLNSLPFLKNAKKILDTSIQKDKERQGV